MKRIFVTFIMLCLFVVSAFSQPQPQAQIMCHLDTVWLGPQPAPLGDGVVILLAFSLIYLSYKIWKQRKESISLSRQ